MSWTSRLHIRPNLLHIAPLLAVTGLALAGCSKDENPPPGPGSTAFIGVAAGPGVSGSLSVTVGTATPAPAGASRITRPATVVTATGTFTVTGGSAIALTGTYDDQTNALIVAGGGYSFTGLYANGVLAGSFTGPGPVDGVFSMQVGTAGSVSTYCGTYTSETGGSGGTFNLAVGATTLSGVGYDTGTDTSFPLVGTVDVDDSLHISLAGQIPVPHAEGKISADGSAVAGVYDDGQGDSGTWSGELCSAASGTTSFSGIAAGHGEAGSLSLTVATSTPGPARAGRTAVVASGVYDIEGGATVNLTGTYDTGTKAFNLTGSGYTFTGVYASASRQEGTWTSASTSGEWVCTTSGAAVDTYCGTYTSTASSDVGRLGLVLNAGVVMGVFVSDTPSATPMPLDGIYAGTAVTIYFPGSTTNVFATGTIATGATSITGTYDDQASEQGDWTATLCPPPPTSAARAQWMRP